MGTFRQAQHKRSRDWTQVSCIAGKFFTIWVIREVQHSGPYMQRKQNRHYEQITKCIYSRIRSKNFQRYFQLLLPLSNTLSELPYCFQYFSIFSINIYSTLDLTDCRQISGWLTQKWASNYTELLINNMYRFV